MSDQKLLDYICKQGERKLKDNGETMNAVDFSLGPPNAFEMFGRRFLLNEKKDVDVEQLRPTDDDLRQDDIDRFFAAFIEMIIGPEHAHKNIHELTDDQKEKIVKAISNISSDLLG